MDVMSVIKTMMNTKTMLLLLTFLLARAHAECDISVYTACQTAKLEDTVFSGAGGTQCDAEQMVVDNTFECLDESDCCAMKNDFMPPQTITEVQGRCPNFRVPVCGAASLARFDKTSLLVAATLTMMLFRL